MCRYLWALSKCHSGVRQFSFRSHVRFESLTFPNPELLELMRFGAWKIPFIQFIYGASPDSFDLV